MKRSFDVVMPSNLFALVESTVKPSQTLNDRFIELIQRGLDAEKNQDDAEVTAQLKELFREGKFHSDSGVLIHC